MSWLILAADGVPASHRPLLPIDDFGAYAAGLPTLGAFLSALSGISVPKATLLFACLAHFILTGALYAVFRRRVGPVAASIAALTVTTVSTDPQLHFFWGGNPTVLALCMLVGGWACLEALMDESRRALIPAALLLAGALVAHSVLPLGFAFLLIPLGVLKLWPLSWRCFCPIFYISMFSEPPMSWRGFVIGNDSPRTCQGALCGYSHCEW